MGLTHAWLDELDVVGPRWRTSVWGWAVLALGLALGLHAWQQHQQAQAALQAAQDEVARLTRAQQGLARATSLETQPVPSTAAASETSATTPGVPTLDDAGWRRAAQLAAWLSVDWSAQMDSAAMAAAEQRLVLTHWALDLSSWSPVPPASALPSVRLQAWTRDDDSPLVWLSTLGPQAELQSRERLTEPAETRWGNLVWRVQAQAPMAALITRRGAP